MTMDSTQSLQNHDRERTMEPTELGETDSVSRWNSLFRCSTNGLRPASLRTVSDRRDSADRSFGVRPEAISDASRYYSRPNSTTAAAIVTTGSTTKVIQLSTRATTSERIAGGVMNERVAAITFIVLFFVLSEVGYQAAALVGMFCTVICQTVIDAMNVGKNPPW